MIIDMGTTATMTLAEFVNQGPTDQ